METVTWISTSARTTLENGALMANVKTPMGRTNVIAIWASKAETVEIWCLTVPEIHVKMVERVLIAMMATLVFACQVRRSKLCVDFNWFQAFPATAAKSVKTLVATKSVNTAEFATSELIACVLRPMKVTCAKSQSQIRVITISVANTVFVLRPPITGRL